MKTMTAIISWCKVTIPSIIAVAESWNPNCQGTADSQYAKPLSYIIFSTNELKNPFVNKRLIKILIGIFVTNIKEKE